MKKLTKKKKLLIKIELAALCITCASFFVINSCKEPDYSKHIEPEQEEQLQQPLTRSGGLAWSYPVRPGMAEWRQYRTGQQKWEACQIPQNILETLSTEELAEICFNFPLFLNFAAFDDERFGIRYVVNNFNGLKELSNRKDGARELVNIYRTCPVISQRDENYTLTKLSYLELLLSDDAFIKQMDDGMYAELEKIVLEKYLGKLENSHIYSLYNINKTFLLGAVITVNRNSGKTFVQQRTARRFIDNFDKYDPELLTEMSKIISGL